MFHFLIVHFTPTACVSSVQPEIILLLQLHLLEEFLALLCFFVCLFSLRKSISLFCKIGFPGVMVPAHFYWNQSKASVADYTFGSNPVCPVLGAATRAFFPEPQRNSR